MLNRLLEVMGNVGKREARLRRPDFVRDSAELHIIRVLHSRLEDDS